MKTTVLNSKGEPIVLNAQELAIAESLQQVLNAPAMREYVNSHLPVGLRSNSLGYEIDITTLTTFIKSITEQKFFEVAPADYMPVKVGEGAWGTTLDKYVTSNIAGDFEEGNLNTGAGNSRLAEADAGVAAISKKIIPWAKTIGWSLIDLAIASRSNNWDIVTAKERSRKKNWDLGIQKIAFLGSKHDTSVDGLLTQSTVNSNTALITKLISSMTAAEFNALVKAIYAAYRTNCNYTAKPTHFIIPETDFNGLVSYPDATYPLKTKLQLLTEAFQQITGNANFKVLPLAYGAQAVNAGSQVASLGKNRYVLLNYDEDSLRMDIPVDYTATIANSINGFQFQNVGYGQYAGVVAYRPLEMLYFDWAS